MVFFRIRKEANMAHDHETKESCEAYVSVGIDVKEDLTETQEIALIRMVSGTILVDIQHLERISEEEYKKHVDEEVDGE